jgi:hypothetical protein
MLTMLVPRLPNVEAVRAHKHKRAHTHTNTGAGGCGAVSAKGHEPTAADHHDAQVKLRSKP